MNRKNGPLHYIAQPDLYIGSGKMQKNFISNKHKKSASFDMNGRMIVEDYSDAVDKSDTIGKREEATKKKNNPVVKHPTEKKAFKDMNIEERIMFLMNRPFYIPASPCEIQTQGKSYFGFIEKYEYGEISLRHLNGQDEAKIPRRDVTGILLLRM